MLGGITEQYNLVPYVGYLPATTDVYLMTSRRRQLKEQITRTKDPVIRMQLQELLNKKRQRHYKGIRKIEEPLDSVLREAINKFPASALRVLVLILITIILFIIFMILECRA
jgi:hypothetical protein